MTSTDFDFLCRFVRERTAIVLEPGKEYLVESRLGPVARRLGLASIPDLVRRLRAAPDDGAAADVVEAMVTTETSFNRDVRPFEALRTAVIPELIGKRRGERRLRFWCAACSTGQEPYSLALLVREHFPELRGWGVDILATDVSRDVLAKARAGRYTQFEANRGLPAATLVKHFRQHGTAWELNDDVRRMIEFRELNLVRPWPPLPRFDLVMLRNVMIYFDVDTKKCVLRNVARVLAPDGYLLLGGAETTLNLDSAYRRVEHGKVGFYQPGG